MSVVFWLGIAQCAVVGVGLVFTIRVERQFKRRS